MMIGLALCGVLLSGCNAVDTPEACRVEHVADLPISMVRGLPVVMAQIGGRSLKMIVDTGAEGVVITPGAADRLGLDRDFSSYGTSTGLGAQASFWPTKPVALQLGPVTTDPMLLVVGTVPALRDRDAPEGLLGGAALSAYDLDFDVAGRHLGLYRARRCPAGPAPFVGASFPVTASQVGATRVAVPVVLDGRSVSMLVDTGANRSMVDPVAAGVADTEVQADRTGFMKTADPVGLDVHLHAFRTLQLGGSVVDKPYLAVAQIERRGYAGLLGTDYWRSHRLWLSYGSRTLFVGTPPLH